ncbi:MAG: HPF/RaiA family ribosome-associated protein [Bryobacteraceae bacterium]
MNLTMIYKNVYVHPPADKDVSRRVAKLEKLLKSYSPDLVQLHAAFEKQARRVEFGLTLNLTLPTGKLHCLGKGSDLPKCVKAAFTELESMVKKHQSRLRHDHEWKRKRPRSAALA